MEQLHGVLVLDKPRGRSSAWCTNALKRLGQRKIGHAGTLDPMARGVLLVLLGQATKLSGHVMAGGTKTYAATVEFGRTTDTWDDAGRETSRMDPDALRSGATGRPGFAAELASAVEGWVGVGEQDVPPYSAAKHEGRPLYALARAGRETPAKTKMVEISRAEVLRVDPPSASFRIVCSSGTYVRSLAHSLGVRFGCGAVLTELIREYSHPFGLGDAVGLDDLLDDPGLLPRRVLPITAALPGWPVLTASGGDEAEVRNGKALAADRVSVAGVQAGWTEGARAFIADASGTPLALAGAAYVDGEPCWTVLRGLWT